MDETYHRRIGRVGTSDFFNLFQPSSQWQKAAAAISIFKLVPHTLRTASDSELAQVISYLNHHHIKLAIEFGILHPHKTCGYTEGHDVDQLDIARRIRRLGGEVAFFAVDEPLYFGHSFDGKEGCRRPIEALAKEAAEIARQFHSIFPRVRFVDIEPISNFREPNWVDLVSRWHKAFYAAYGEPFAAFHLDINWQRSWRERVRLVTDRMRQDRMRVGVICDGNPKDPTSAAWTANALKHCQEYQTLVGHPPADVIFQSWMKHPTHVLPESAVDSFTHLILEYAATHPGLISARN